MGVSWDTKTFECGGDGEGKFAEALYHLEYDTYRPNKYGKTPSFYRDLAGLVVRTQFVKNCEYLAYASGRTLTLCPKFFKQTLENRVSTLVHEGRHMESSDPSHVDCVGGKYDKKKAACDQYFYDGSWKGSGFNADVFYSAWALRNGNDLHGLKRAVIQAELNALVPDRFNHISAEMTKKWRDVR
jgi:hypothetical protein